MKNWLILGWLIVIACLGVFLCLPCTAVQNTDLTEKTDLSLAQGQEIVDYQADEVDTVLRESVERVVNQSAGGKKWVSSLVKHPVNESVRSASSPITVPADLPASFDWRDNNGDFTTPIRDQGEECGSCWAHAAIAVLESYWKIKEQDPDLQIGFSEQYLLSCDMDDSGCDGGDFETAMPYLVDTPGPDGEVGVVLRSDYPYEEHHDDCKDLTGLPRYRADRWAYVNATADEGAENGIPPVDELKAAIYLKGPIAVGVEDDDAFDEYEGGIFVSDAEYEDTNHAVVLVGWGEEDGEEYFIGKNSAGTEWGEDGWFRIDVYSNRIGEGAVYLDSF